LPSTARDSLNGGPLLDLRLHYSHEIECIVEQIIVYIKIFFALLKRSLTFAKIAFTQAKTSSIPLIYRMGCSGFPANRFPAALS
jgi:hypothetical protein